MSDMTRERAREVLEMMLEDKDVRKALLRTDVDAMKIAISALTEELSEDGTLTVHVSDGSKVKRVFVMGDNIFGGLYYPDSADDNTMEWISAKVGKLFPSNDYKCSKCGNILNFDGVNCGRGDANFCPNCGRKAVSK